MSKAEVSLDAYGIKMVEDNFRGRLQEAAEIVADEARRLCPVDTGKLRDSIHVDDSNPFAPAVVADAPYALYVEEGTRFQEGQHFLAQAIANTRDQVEEVLARPKE